MDEENINELEKNSDEESSNVPEPETNSDSHETNMELDSQGKSLLAVGSKALIAKLLKAKILSIVLIGGGIFFLFIVIIGVLFGSEVPEYQYVEPSIDKVTVTYDPYGPDDGDTKTYDLEEYVRRALYAYIDDIPREEEGNFHLYSALVIALRTEALSKDGQITYRDKDLSKDYEERPEAEEALKTFEGIIITDKDDNYIDVSVSSFCWHEENADDYLLYQKDLAVLKTFTNVYLHNNIYATCPCNEETGDPFAEDSPYDICWVTWDTDDDGIDDEAEYKHTDNEDGFSFYGAYYELKGQGYLYTHILESFFGKDIYYRTTIEGKEIVETYTCSGDSMPFNYTPLSKEEFVSLVEEFFGDGSGFADYYKYFVDYAGEIYDMGLEKNINPELIYIFARKETSFRTNSADTRHYNYYGFGHCNTCENGTFFDSFMDGVETLFDYFAEKGSLQNVVSVYSYLGDLLYNYDESGEMGAGGCYYLEIIYGDNYSRCDDSYYCSPKNTASCVATTEEERQAYIQWQAEKYIEHRMAIFKLGVEICVGSQINTDATLDIASSMLKTPLKDFLETKGLSINDLNMAILNNVVQNGVGTRAGVAAAATTLINYMNNLDVRIPYTYSGGHGYIINGVSSEVTTSYYGVDPDWGTSIGNYYYSNGYGPYTNHGPDCSAFVSWVLHNGGVKMSINTATSIKSAGPNYPMDGNYIGQVGDVVSSGGHVRIIVGVNVQEKYYITAESQSREGQFNPDTKGISYKKMDFNNKNYVIVDLSQYYNDSNKNYSQNEDEFITAFNNGVK